jgi:hypothetical protein
MPNPVFKGAPFRLKGGKDEKTKNVTLVAMDVQANARIRVFGGIYEWFGIVPTGGLNGRKVKVDLQCNLGETLYHSRGRYRGRPFGTDDLVDVTVTITNPGSAEEVPVEPNAVVELI